jgi:membrane protein YqaA with SNARE-associated domain
MLLLGESGHHDDRYLHELLMTAFNYFTPRSLFASVLLESLLLGLPTHPLIIAASALNLAAAALVLLCLKQLQLGQCHDVVVVVGGIRARVPPDERCEEISEASDEAGRWYQQVKGRDVYARCRLPQAR